MGSNGTGSSIPSSSLPQCQLLHLLTKLHILFAFPTVHCNPSKIQSSTTKTRLCSSYPAAPAHLCTLLPKSPLQSALHGKFPPVLCCSPPQRGNIGGFPLLSICSVLAEVFTPIASPTANMLLQLNMVQDSKNRNQGRQTHKSNLSKQDMGSSAALMVKHVTV